MELYYENKTKKIDDIIEKYIIEQIIDTIYGEKISHLNENY
jgi:hypothetical protein